MTEQMWIILAVVVLITGWYLWGIWQRARAYVDVQRRGKLRVER